MEQQSNKNRPWAKKVVVRARADGTYWRMHPGGFGTRFPSGPYQTALSAALAPMNLHKAIDELQEPTAPTDVDGEK